VPPQGDFSQKINSGCVSVDLFDLGQLGVGPPDTLPLRKGEAQEISPGDYRGARGPLFGNTRARYQPLQSPSRPLPLDRRARQPGSSHVLASQSSSTSCSSLGTHQPIRAAQSRDKRTAKILYEGGYGVADLDPDIKITLSTVFLSGSMSKPFTAAAVLMSGEQGKVSLDDSSRKYRPRGV
jgi:hypothetical protein